MPGFNAPLRVAIATGDTNLGVFLCGSLKPEGYAAGYCADGLEALNALERDPFDLLILDTDLPLLDGLELCRRLRLTMRNAATPILMISARGDVEDRVAGLEAGADDYLPRPFAVRELRARVHALLRRREREAGEPLLAGEDIVLDRASREATRAGQPLHLTAREFDLLALLLASAPRVLPRTVIMERVWGDGSASESNVIDVCLHSLRKKLGPPNVIHSVRRAGFVFRPATVLSEN